IAITPDGKTAYVVNESSGTVTPISTATNKPGPPIKINGSGITGPIAITPDGKTAYDGGGEAKTSTPTPTATNTPGKPIPVGSGPVDITVTPDGKTAYVANYYSGNVTPIRTATNTPGAPIKIRGRNVEGGPIVITPDGKTAYVLGQHQQGRGFTPDTLTPITTATNHAGKPITVGPQSQAIAITP